MVSRCGRSGRGVAEGDQGRPSLRRPGPGAPVAPIGGAGRRRPLAHSLRHGRPHPVIPPPTAPAMGATRPVMTALAIGTAGGILFHDRRLSLPWMMGAMVATTVVSRAVPQAIPALVAPAHNRCPGCPPRQQFHPRNGGPDARLAAEPGQPAALHPDDRRLALAYLRKVARLDPLSAFFCATPGGLGKMAILGDRAGGDLRTISLVHATRILLIVVTVPAGLSPHGLPAARDVDGTARRHQAARPRGPGRLAGCSASVAGSCSACRPPACLGRWC